MHPTLKRVYYDIAVSTSLSTDPHHTHQGGDRVIDEADVSAILAEFSGEDLRPVVTRETAMLWSVDQAGWLILRETNTDPGDWVDIAAALPRGTTIDLGEFEPFTGDLELTFIGRQ